MASQVACGIPPNLTLELRNSCPEDLTPKSAKPPECPPLLVKFGEVQVEMEVELGMDQLTWMGQKPHLKAKKIGAASYKFIYDEPGHHAVSLLMVHDYFSDAPIKSKPEVKKAKWRSFGNSVEEIEIFKKTPWEFVGYTSSNYQGGMDIRTEVNLRNDFTKDTVKDYTGELRAAYFREAEELVDERKGKLRKQEKAFQSYIDGKLIEYVSYTNTMMVLWSMAACGNLSFDAYTRKFRIGDDAKNPGTSRKVKMVFNLYYKIVKGEFASNKDTIFTPIKLDNKAFEESGVGHEKRTCLKCVVVLNDKDGSDNTKGVFFFGLSWGRGNPDATFMQNIANREPVYNSLTGKGSGKGGFSGNYNNIDPTFEGKRNGVGLKTEKQDEWISIRENGEGPATTAMSRADQIKIIREEHDYAFGLAGMSESSPGFRVALLRQWSTPKDVKPIRLVKMDVQKKAGNQGIEITPGLNLFLTAGQNVTSGDIQGAAAQIQILLPLEAFAVLGSEDLTFETLPGTMFNIFASATAVIKIDIKPLVSGTYQIVNMYLKAEALKKQMEEMKKYCESVKARMQGLAQDLTNAFNNKDLAAYNAALAKMQKLADEFAQRSGTAIDLKLFYEGGSNLKLFIDASNAAQNLPVVPPNTSGGTSTPPALSEPIAELPGNNFNAEPPSVSPGSPESKLVLPGIEVSNPQPLGDATTSLPVDPVILTPSALPPTESSGEALGFTGSANNFDNLDGYNNLPSEGVWIY